MNVGPQFTCINEKKHERSHNSNKTFGWTVVTNGWAGKLAVSNWMSNHTRVCIVSSYVKLVYTLLVINGSCE